MPRILKVSNRGFTLIELLIAVAIIVMLTLFAFVSFSNIQRSGRDTKRTADLQAVAGVLQRFYSDWSHYPSSQNGMISIDTSNCADIGDNSEISWGDGIGNTLGDITSFTCTGNGEDITYTRELPQDPFRRAPEYCYEVGASNQSFILYARVESNNVRNLTPSVNCGGSSGAPYNYRVTSTD